MFDSICCSQVEVTVLKKIRHVLKPLLRDERSEHIDSSFAAVREEIRSASLNAPKRQTGGRLLPTILGIGEDMAGDTASFNKPIAILVRAILVLLYLSVLLLLMFICLACQTELANCYGQPSRQLVALMELVEAINSVAASNIEVRPFGWCKTNRFQAVTMHFIMVCSRLRV